jgi:hypothetical protein
MYQIHTIYAQFCFFNLLTTSSLFLILRPILKIRKAPPLPPYAFMIRCLALRYLYISLRVQPHDVKVKVKFSLERATKALDEGGWLTPRPGRFYPRERDPVPIVYEAPHSQSGCCQLKTGPLALTRNRTTVSQSASPSPSITLPVSSLL